MVVQSDVPVRAELPTSVGTFEALLTDAGVRELRFPNQRTGEAGRPHPLAGPLAEELDAYLRGRLRRFETPLDLRGTAFQLMVWNELRRIEYGQVRRYGELAAIIGRPTAFRAVGAANGANPVPIIVPCHRLIAADGGLIKFGAGIEWKRRLLTIENPEREAPGPTT
ncbi:MAG TPA: methylated-DNA--[protein]-cysteine S-methyltransferase [Candidatus Dormibacteraeota bacterium]|jgi:methylated-DNA-[protein]-cysteine S-methyltransferase|nr:methylated-DNA--[protein]-cysteine S-methyltransferase [Candidatus Dormibacteraeota bacterium]